MQPSAPATTSADALTQLQQYQGSLKTPQDALNAAKTGLGVDAAKTTATGLQGAIQNTTSLLGKVAPSVYGRSANSLVTSAQAGRQIQNESAPLQATLEQQGTDYTNAENNYKDLAGEAETEANSTIADQSTRAGLMQNIYENLYGKEQDSSKLAEEQRQFNETQATTKASAAASSSSGLGSTLSSILGGNSVTPVQADPAKAQATSAVNGLLKSDPKTVQTTYNAIKKSAGFGNTYDQLKLQLLDHLNPNLAKGYK